MNTYINTYIYTHTSMQHIYIHIYSYMYTYIHTCRFSIWPGLRTEFFFLVNMIAICATTVSMETASYHNRTADQIIVVAGGMISTVSITLVGLIVLRKSRVCYYIFQDELYAPFNPSSMKRL